MMSMLKCESLSAGVARTTTSSSKASGNGTATLYDDRYHVIASVDGGLYTEW